MLAKSSRIAFARRTMQPCHIRTDRDDEAPRTAVVPVTTRKITVDQHPGAGPAPEHGGEALGLGADPRLDDLTLLGEDVNLAFPLVDIDVNMIHGWPPLSAALTAGCSCGAAYATTSSGRPAPSSRLSSSRFLRLGYPLGGE